MAGVGSFVRLGVVAAGLIALGLAGCGRAGPLEPPPGPGPAARLAAPLTAPGEASVAGSPQDGAAKTGFDAQGNPVATSSGKRSFILDPLLQ